jgi:hypothetical protein
MLHAYINDDFDDSHSGVRVARGVGSWGERRGLMVRVAESSFRGVFCFDNGCNGCIG